MDYRANALVIDNLVIPITKYISLFFIILTTNIYAQSGWAKYGWQLFENSGDARSIAMGNAMVADGSNISSLWNPINGIDDNNITYSHQSRFAGIVQSDLFAYPIRFRNTRHFNLIILHESVGKIPNTQNLLLDWGLDGVPNTKDFGENNGYLDEGERLDNEDISFFNQHQVGVHLSTQFTVYDFEFGVAIKTMFHSLDSHFGTGIGLDIGMKRSFWNNSNVGLSIQNILPSMVVWDSGTTELSKPRILAGISQNIKISNSPISASILGDVLINITEESLSDAFNIGSTGGNWRVGAKLNYKNKLDIRIGRNQYGFYATGLGIAWTNFDLNYAYQFNSKSNELGRNHIFSFGVDSDWIIDILRK